MSRIKRFDYSSFSSPQIVGVGMINQVIEMPEVNPLTNLPISDFSLLLDPQISVLQKQNILARYSGLPKVSFDGLSESDKLTLLMSRYCGTLSERSKFQSYLKSIIDSDQPSEEQPSEDQQSDDQQSDVQSSDDQPSN